VLASALIREEILCVNIEILKHLTLIWEIVIFGGGFTNEIGGEFVVDFFKRKF